MSTRGRSGERENIGGCYRRRGGGADRGMAGGGARHGRVASAGKGQAARDEDSDLGRGEVQPDSCRADGGRPKGVPAERGELSQGELPALHEQRLPRHSPPQRHGDLRPPRRQDLPRASRRRPYRDGRTRSRRACVRREDSPRVPGRGVARSRIPRYRGAGGNLRRSAGPRRGDSGRRR